MQSRLKANELATGHQRVERRLLERDADRLADLARLGDDVVAGDLRGAARGAQERGEHADRGRLAGAVRAEEGVDLALGDVEVDAAHGLYLVSELPFQPPNLDRIHWRPSLGSAPERRTCGLHAPSRLGLVTGTTRMCLGIVFNRNSRPRSRVAQREPNVNRSAISIISALVATALVVAAGAAFAAGGGRRRRGRWHEGLRQGRLEAQAVLPEGREYGTCLVVGSLTTFINKLGEKKHPFVRSKRRQDRRLVDRARATSPATSPPRATRKARATSSSSRTSSATRSTARGPWRASRS